MTDNFIDAQYDLTKKSKIRNFYEKYKILIISFVLIIIIIIGSFFFYFESKENKRILLSENYVEAKILLLKKNESEALQLLKKIIYANDSTYSTLAFFLVVNNDLVNDNKEILILYDHLIENNKFDKELKNLLIYKKALFTSNFLNELELLKTLKPLLNKNSIWKPHALLLMGDYFVSKGENIKAIEFYQQILTISNLQQEIYDLAKSKLIAIANE